MIAATSVLRGVERHIGLLQELVGVSAIHRSHGNADRGADVDTVTIDIEGILESSGQPLGEPFGILVALRANLQHDELVAAKARDHVARRPALSAAWIAHARRI